MQLGGLMQTASAFNQVQSSLSWFIDAYPQFASWKATVDKVELPSAEQVQTMLSNAQQARQTLAGGATDTSTQAQAGLGAYYMRDKRRIIYALQRGMLQNLIFVGVVEQ